MRVSIVIPTLNEAKFLPKCLASISEYGAALVQEVIVVDAGSTDSTVHLAEQAGVLVLKKCNSTIAGQRNAGAKAASSELIAFLDADCTIELGWAEHAIPHFGDLNIVSVGAPPNIPESNTTWVQETWSFLKRKPRTKPSDVSWIASANVWVRKKTFDQIGGFDETLETCEDADLGFRMKQIGRIVADPRIRVQHHREPRTLPEFYKKEVWHGKHSFDGIAGGRVTLEELPSLITPILFAGSFVLLVCGLAFFAGWGKWLSVLGLLGIAVAPFAYTIRSLLRKGQWARTPQFLLVYFVYFAARADAFLRWLLRRVIYWVGLSSS